MSRERWGSGGRHPDLVGAARAVAVASGRPFVIENVPGAPLRDPFLLCGSMFGLPLRRHRVFEASFPVTPPACAHAGQGRVVRVYGHTGGRSRRDGAPFATVGAWRDAMGIQWMTARELTLAVPPAYAEFVARAWLSATR